MASKDMVRACVWRCRVVMGVYESGCGFVGGEEVYGGEEVVKYVCCVSKNMVRAYMGGEEVYGGIWASWGL